MYIKIYFGDKPVFLCDEINKELNTILHHPDAVFVDEINTAAINSLLHEIIKPEFHAGVLWNADFDRLKKAFFKHFTVIDAAGGIVQNADKEILFICRLGKWDLPKGKLEKGEKLEDCAVREVEEETGATNIKLKKKAGETYHTYKAYGKYFLKISHWYFMSCSGKQNLVPQTIEDITDIKWVAVKNLKDVLSNTYPSIEEILGVFAE
jgi:8-oxo-dGTP pyrophosphatase MutT (NUDIX family)